MEKFWKRFFGEKQVIFNGKNGYIVFTREKLLTPEDVAVIKNDTGTQREKAKKYGLSVGTINKIMNDKY